MNIIEQEMIDIWYSGLDREFFDMISDMNHGSIKFPAKHNDPKVRTMHYAIKCIVNLIFIIPLFLTIKLAYDNGLPTNWKALDIGFLCYMGPVAALVCLEGYFLKELFSYLNSIKKLRYAMRNGLNTDTNDPKRLEVIRMAVKWGLTKKIILKNSNGQYELTQKK